MKIIVPGSFDPVTLGHVDIIERAARECDELYAVIFINPDKCYRFSLDDRLAMLSLATRHIKNVRVDFSNGRVVDYMKDRKIDKIYKGYRNDADLEYEKVQADYNFKNGGYETVLLKSAPSLSSVSSTRVRELLEAKCEPCDLLPLSVLDFLRLKD